MPGPMSLLKTTFDRVEEFFDQIKLGYKWRFDRWNELRIQTYRGHGTPQRLYLKGRVLDDRGATLDESHASLWKNITNTIRRIETDEIPGARVRLSFRGVELDAETDGDGYFTVEIEPEEPLQDLGTWHELEVELLSPEDPDGHAIRAVGEAVVPSAEAEFAVISDVDDTVIQTGATNRLRMTRTVLLNNAHTRTAFEGIAGFYRALQLGPDDAGLNPIFYVSSSPWNLYGHFAAFMDAHDIPAGPIFLKDFGFSESKFFSDSHTEHKRAKIQTLLETYPDLPFILIGDSGQKDPEIYRQVVRDHPDRIRAVFVRDVTPPERDEAVRRIAEEVEAAGTPMFLVQDTEDAAQHALEEGLISAAAREEVRVEKQKEQEKEPGLLHQLLAP